MNFRMFLWAWLGAYAMGFLYAIGLMFVAGNFGSIPGLMIACAVTGFFFAGTWALAHAFMPPSLLSSLTIGIVVAFAYAVLFMHFDYTFLSAAQIFVWGTMSGVGTIVGLRGQRKSDKS